MILIIVNFHIILLFRLPNSSFFILNNKEVTLFLLVQLANKLYHSINWNKLLLIPNSRPDDGDINRYLNGLNGRENGLTFFEFLHYFLLPYN